METSAPPTKRKPGRPKGSKDKPRPKGAPPRGRPKQKKHTVSSEIESVSATDADSDADDEFGFDDDFSEEFLRGADQMERKALAALRKTAKNLTAATETLAPTSDTPATPEHAKPGLRQLRTAAVSSTTKPFFTPQNPGLGPDDDSDDDEVNSQNEDDAPDIRLEQMSTARVLDSDSVVLGPKAWFKQPKYMPDWLYKFFAETVTPIITAKDGKFLAKPTLFSETRAYPSSSFWILPPEPVTLLSQRRFDLPALYRPRVFLWLPHFYVAELRCPNCPNGILEKNGPLTPRRITDIDDSFYIVSWAYYCRKGCRAHFHGWSQRFIESLPPYLRHAFPATLSYKGGLSRNVISLLRVGNQHKMGPCGVRSFLLEAHTLRFSIRQAQFLEAAFETVRGRQAEGDKVQSSLHSYLVDQVPSFGDFADPQGYAGFVPTDRYLTMMLNKVIERDEHYANQHTACLPLDQIAIDDSHKINKHIAKVEGIAIFSGMWSCMDTRYIHDQTMTLTKSHEEREGPLQGLAGSVELYGHDGPRVAFSDDPAKDKHLVYNAFPSLATNLAPVAAAYGLRPLEMDGNSKVSVLGTLEIAEKALSSLILPLDLDPEAHLCVSLDAEWNLSRRVGVSIIQIAPHSEPNIIFVIPVHKFGKSLPPSLLRLLISNRVFKIGSAVQNDLTRMKKQFPHLAPQAAFNVIDLKEYCIQRGIISRRDPGSLDKLVEKTLGMYISKDDNLRKSEQWEEKVIPPQLLHYAALDAYASRLIFEKATEVVPLQRVQFDSSPGTCVAVLVQEGGDVAAFGRIALIQPNSLTTSLGKVIVKTPTKSRLVIDVDTVLIPSAAAILHLPPQRSTGKEKTRSGALTLEQLKTASYSTDLGFQVVVPLSHLAFDCRKPAEIDSPSPPPCVPMASSMHPSNPVTVDEINSNSDSDEEEFTPSESTVEVLGLQMLEANPCQSETSKGKKRQHESISHPTDTSDPLQTLQNIIESPPDANDPPFDQMLLRSPRFIQERVPRHVPPPSVLVPAMQHVFNTFGNSLDAKTGAPLFTKQAWQKANAVLDLARQGYLSDLDGVPMYERAGVDNYGLQKWKCVRGTNNVEGGPHGDIYRKFGALHAGPRLTVNCLTDHRTWYNLQAYAKHMYGVDYEYHHDLGLINRTSFLLNYLSDTVEGARSYSDWTNGDLYERTTRTFGISPVPAALRERLAMEPYTDVTASTFKLNPSDDWLRKRQNLALPALPPTTPAARRYFFSKIREHATNATAEGKSKINYQAFAQEWNRSADGKERFYVTTEVLVAYAKTWDKISNIHASQDLISSQLESTQKTSDIFAAPHQPFPEFLTSSASSSQPCQGMLDLDHPGCIIPRSLIIDPSLSRTQPMLEKPRHKPAYGPPVPQAGSVILMPPTAVSLPQSEPRESNSSNFPHQISDVADPTQVIQQPWKRRRVVPDAERKRSTRRCRRCHEATCSGNSNILLCQKECTVPCRKCGQLTGCRGVDGGRECTLVYP